MGCSPGQSYAAAGCTAVSVSDRGVFVQVVFGPTDDDYAEAQLVEVKTPFTITPLLFNRRMP